MSDALFFEVALGYLLSQVFVLGALSVSLGIERWQERRRLARHVPSNLTLDLDTYFVTMRGNNA